MAGNVLQPLIPYDPNELITLSTSQVSELLKLFWNILVCC